MTQRLVCFEESLDTEVHRAAGGRQLQAEDSRPISRSWKTPGKPFPGAFRGCRTCHTSGSDFQPPDLSRINACCSRRPRKLSGSEKPQH